MERSEPTVRHWRPVWMVASFGLVVLALLGGFAREPVLGWIGFIGSIVAVTRVADTPRRGCGWSFYVLGVGSVALLVGLRRGGYDETSGLVCGILWIVGLVVIGTFLILGAPRTSGPGVNRRSTGDAEVSAVRRDG